MKDNIKRQTLPRIGTMVGWEETYRSSGEVLQRRVVWGVVEDTYYHHGDSDGHRLQGDYVFVTVQDGSELFIHSSDIISVQP